MEHDQNSSKWQKPLCPICGNEIGFPVWLEEKYGKKYAAYCNDCKRAYTESECKWVDAEDA